MEEEEGEKGEAGRGEKEEEELAHNAHTSLGFYWQMMVLERGRDICFSGVAMLL